MERTTIVTSKEHVTSREQLFKYVFDFFAGIKFELDEQRQQAIEEKINKLIDQFKKDGNRIYDELLIVRDLSYGIEQKILINISTLGVLKDVYSIEITTKCTSSRLLLDGSISAL